LDLSKLADTDILIGDLGGIRLGQADGLIVSLDDDAAGYGWSTSPVSVNPSGGIDLLSAMVHEFGHVLGYEHDVLGESLASGERFLPFMGVMDPLA
jgi:hypothetical protein